MPPHALVFRTHNVKTVQDCSPEGLPSRRKCKTSAQPGEQQPQKQDRESTQAVSQSSQNFPSGIKNLETRTPNGGF
jgi:hypothetical protein